MVKVALLVRLVAKPGKEEDLAAFLSNALPLAEDEPFTISWFAMRFSSGELGIFDVFRDDAGREAHIHGVIADKLRASASELLAARPTVEKVDLIAAKLATAR